MNFDELAAAQQQTGKEITRIYTNYKKDSPSRKTLDYLQKRLQELDEAWSKFDETDSDIREKFGSQLEHPYFKKGYYDSMRKGYDEIREDIIKRIKELEGKGESNTASKSATDTISQQDEAPNSINQGNINTLIRRQEALMEALHRTLSSLPSENETRSDQYFQLKIKLIQQYWNQIENLHLEIVEQGPSDTTYKIEDYCATEQKVQDVIIELHERLKPECQSVVEPLVASTTSSLMKLPKIALPKFDGDYLKWTQFHDLFTEMVHNQSMANCQKMWYLKTSLHGEAERLVRHLTISDSNYTAAWKMIKERYENTRLLTSAYLNKLLSQPTLTTEGAAPIKALHDTTQECLLALENLGVPTKQWDPLLLHILLKKLDKSTHVLYEQSLKEPRGLQSISNFLTFLELRFQSLEAFGGKVKTTEEHGRKNYTTRSLATTATSASHCLLCKGNHGLFGCSRFLQFTPSKRLQWSRKAGS